MANNDLRKLALNALCDHLINQIDAAVDLDVWDRLYTVYTDKNEEVPNELLNDIVNDVRKTVEAKILAIKEA